MNFLEKNIVSMLTELKENYYVKGIKAEFETEGSSFDEVLILKELISKVNLDLTIKIGGCEAITDINETKKIGAQYIVAPMIETPYAMKKYVQALNSVFDNNENQKFLINIETITGYNNFNDIVLSPDFAKIDGVVLGRGDMAASMELTKEEVNSSQIYDIALVMSNKMRELNKPFTVGGGVSGNSLPFFKKLPYLTNFQTRKVIFDAQKLLKLKNAETAILKAIDFELMWLKNKQEHFGASKQDEARVQMLTKYKNLVNI